MEELNEQQMEVLLRLAEVSDARISLLCRHAAMLVVRDKLDANQEATIDVKPLLIEADNGIREAHGAFSGQHPELACTPIALAVYSLLVVGAVLDDLSERGDDEVGAFSQALSEILQERHPNE